MADNLRVIPGTSTNPLVATDDVGGVHYMRLKIDGGGDGAAAPVLGDSNYGLDVDVVRFPQPSSAPTTNVPAATASTLLSAANASRKGWMVWNDSPSSMYLKAGTGASATSAMLSVPPGAYFELPSPVYTGVMYAAWVTATGAARVTEMT